MTLTEEFAQLLHDLALGVYKADGTAGGTIYLTNLPQAPDAALAVARYGLAEPDSRLHYDEPGIQVRIRDAAADVTVGEARAQAVWDALHGLGLRTLAGGTWLQLAIAQQGSPNYMGRDGNGRHEWTVNLRCEIEHPTPNRP
ncbi:hypothetical protein GCM10010174_70140 [Kutzneria viridogrisea]|uniref:DUF3168 domain-containing protein n=1 Tax=Kutzneria viridogrisea TaxID=47990 RepID=A0ABR6BAU2_9PSEU|nr:hypothetical protein [Kutzneria viridogrisea]